MKIKKVEGRTNEFVEHLTKMLNDSFGNLPINFHVNYFLGEDTKGTKGLYFVLSSNKAGQFYEKFTPIEIYQTPMDIEEEFIAAVINDLVLAGVTFVNLEKLRSLSDLNKKRGGMITHVIYLN